MTLVGCSEQSPCLLPSQFNNGPITFTLDVVDREYLYSFVERLCDSGALLLSLMKGRNHDTVKQNVRLTANDILTLGYLLSLGLLEKTAKNFCSWPAARVLGNDLPVQEGVDYEYFLGTHYRRFLRSRIPARDQASVVTRRSLLYAISILKLKDSFVEVSDKFINQSFKDYQEKLSTPPPTDEEVGAQWNKDVPLGMVGFGPLDHLSHDQIYERIHRSIRMTVDEVFRKVKGKFADEEPVPSVSSSFSYKRKEGGQWQELVDEQIHAEEEIVGLEYGNDGTCKPVIGSRSLLKGEWALDGRRVKARVVPIKEALKVRWVSIGEANVYYQAKKWNRVVYRQLSDHPTLRLTGRPMRLSDMDLFTHGTLLSGDYKGATDTLDKFWSEVVFEAISYRLFKDDPDYLSIVAGLKAALTGHTLERWVNGKLESTFDQENGQLMGSYLSFPILCILNAAINRLYLDPELTTPLCDLPMLVNGDDILMSRDDGFSGWDRVIALVGLKPSLGKNYEHDSVCCINSEFYQRTEGVFERIQPWCINLVYAQDSDADGGLNGFHVNRPEFLQLSTIGAMARELLRGHSGPEQNFLLSEFISHNKTLLTGTRRCWWTPEILGGLGLPMTQKVIDDGRITEIARKVATYLMTRPDPEDALIYAPRGSPAFTISCRQWMKECSRVLEDRGCEFVWLGEDDVEVEPPLRLLDFVGLGSVPQKGNEPINRYNKVVRLALNSFGASGLTLCSDEKLLDWSNNPRRAGWINPVVEEVEGEEFPSQRQYLSVSLIPARINGEVIAGLWMR
jgi:hypothetical protein